MKNFSLCLRSLLILCVLLSFSGCGGGGGGGGGGGPAGPVVDTEPAPFGAELEVPAGYAGSAGFPAVGTGMVVPNFTADKTSVVVLMNRSTVGRNLALNTSGVFSAAVRSQSPSSYVQTRVAPDGAFAFFQGLRKFQRSLPPIMDGKAAGPRVSGGIRADAEGQRQDFQVYMVDASPLSVTATCRLVRSMNPAGNLNLYLDDQVVWNSTTQALVQELGTAWTSIYAVNRSVFGNEPPASFNGLTLGDDITILLTPAWRTAQPDLAGFFYTGDLYNNPSGGVTNRRKMFYLSYNPAKFSSNTIKSTMAHEFQHMISFYQKKINNLDEETWLDEAMSGYAEHACGYSVNNGKNQSKAIQMNEFFDRVAETSLTAWQDDHPWYGQAFLFGVWLGQKYGGANGNVQGLLSAKSVGRDAVAAFSGETFDRVFARFRLALFLNEYSTAGTKYGLFNINLRGTYSFDALAPVKLTGPKVVSLQVSQGTGDRSVAAFSSLYVTIGGGNGSNLNLAFSTGATAFEMHK